LVRIGEFYCDQYKRVHGIRYPSKEKREWVGLEKVSRRYGLDRMKWCVWKFLRNYEDDPFIAKTHRWSVSSFLMRLPSLLIMAEEAKSRRSKDEFAQDVDGNAALAALADRTADAMTTTQLKLL